MPAVLLVGDADQIETRRIDRSRQFALAQVADGGQRNHGVDPVARVGELAVVEDELPASLETQKLPGGGGEFLRRGEDA